MFKFETETHVQLRNSIRAMMSKHLARFDRPEVWGTVPRELFSLIAELGLCALAIPEEFDGAQADPLTSMVAIEELAYANLGPAIFTCVHNMVAGLIAKHGSPEQKKELLPQFAAGTFLGAFALTEPKAGSDAANLSTSAKKIGSDYILNGEKCYITSAGSADIYLVFARTGEPGGKGISCFAVHKDTPGLTIARPEHKMGCELSPIASISFADAKVPAKMLIGAENAGYAVALSGLSGGRISIAACSNGISRKAFDIALGAVRERSQFGAPIGSYQGVQFMLADLAMALEAAQLLTYQAALEMDRGSPVRITSTRASMAKCFASDTAMKITTDAVQLLGGAGYIKDYGVERLMRDAKMLQIVEGTNQIQRWVIGRELVKEAI